MNEKEEFTFTSITGHGIEVKIEGKDILLGNRKLMVESQISLEGFEESSDKLAGEGKTPMYIAIDNKLAGIIAVADTVKENSKRAIAKLHSMGIEVVMITGDNKTTAEAIVRVRYTQVTVD